MKYQTPFVLAIAATLLFGCSLEKVEVVDGLIEEFSLSNASKSFAVGKDNEFDLKVWRNPHETLLAVNTNVDESSKRINVTATLERRSTPGKTIPAIILSTLATGTFRPNSTGSYVLVAPSSSATQAIYIQ